MTTDLAVPPTEADQPVLGQAAVLERLAAIAEQLLSLAPARDADIDLRCYTPDEAAVLLGKTKNWVIENIQARRIPFTYIGKSPRMTAAHIRWVQENGEVLPNKFSRKTTQAAA